MKTNTPRAKAIVNELSRWLPLFCIAFPLLIGCGPSQAELLMQQARRSRGGDDDPPKSEQIAKVEKPHREQEPNESNPEEEKQKTPETAGEPVAKVDKMVTVGGKEVILRKLIPVSQRKPDQISDDERRQRAYDNLEAVGDALLTYVRDKDRLPRTYQEANGFKTLSWRVEILPYLGYEELYKQFDPSVPWNRPPNKDLLEFIPDQFVSPERFDTNTNLLLPARDGMIAGDGGGKQFAAVDDGMSDTLLLVEVNDRHAVPWTAPEDFQPKSKEDARLSMTGLRKDGCFAVWGNGWPVLMASELTPRMFWDALTIDAGDGQQAGRIHRDISVKQVSKASVVSTKASTPKSDPAASPQPDDKPPSNAVSRVRAKVPTAGERSQVQGRFRSLFSQRIEDAKEDEEKARLAGNLLEAALDIPNDTVGAYVLQTGALRLAIDGGSVEHLIAAVDQRISQFEVDAYEENKKWLLAFGKGVAQKDVRKMDGTAYAKRAVKVIFAGIHDDDYVAASSISRYAYRLIDQNRDEEIPKLLNRLRGLLGSSKREFDGASESLAEFRTDSSNGEAAASVGRFLCFIKGDWGRGLPLLAEGGPDQLQQMATLDMQGAASYLDKVAIGDAWWELSQKARAGVYRQSARDRAVFWYEQAFRFMPDSLDRMHVKSRLDDAKDAPAASPLAVVNDLAEQLSLDLDVGLAAVANVGQKAGRRDGDDE